MGLSTSNGNCLPETERELVRIPGPLTHEETIQPPKTACGEDGCAPETAVGGEQPASNLKASGSSSREPSRQTRPAQVKEDDHTVTEPTASAAVDPAQGQEDGLPRCAASPRAKSEAKAATQSGGMDGNRHHDREACTDHLHQGRGKARTITRLGQDGETEDILKLTSINASSKDKGSMVVE